MVALAIGSFFPQMKSTRDSFASASEEVGPSPEVVRRENDRTANDPAIPPARCAGRSSWFRRAGGSVHEEVALLAQPLWERLSCEGYRGEIAASSSPSHLGNKVTPVLLTLCAVWRISDPARRDLVPGRVR